MPNPLLLLGLLASVFRGSDAAPSRPGNRITPLSSFTSLSAMMPPSNSYMSLSDANPGLKNVDSCSDLSGESRTSTSSSDPQPSKSRDSFDAPIVSTSSSISTSKPDFITLDPRTGYISFGDLIPGSQSRPPSMDRDLAARTLSSLSEITGRRSSVELPLVPELAPLSSSLQEEPLSVFDVQTWTIDNSNVAQFSMQYIVRDPSSSVCIARDKLCEKVLASVLHGKDGQCRPVAKQYLECFDYVHVGCQYEGKDYVLHWYRSPSTPLAWLVSYPSTRDGVLGLLRKVKFHNKNVSQYLPEALAAVADNVSAKQDLESVCAQLQSHSPSDTAERRQFDQILAQELDDPNLIDIIHEALSSVLPLVDADPATDSTKKDVWQWALRFCKKSKQVIVGRQMAAQDIGESDCQKFIKTLKKYLKKNGPSSDLCQLYNRHPQLYNALLKSGDSSSNEIRLQTV